MSISARFESFRVTQDGSELVYSGRTEDDGYVEIRQSAVDADVMLVLFASLCEKYLANTSKKDRSHKTDAVWAEAQGQGNVLLTFQSPPNVTRCFQLDQALSAKLVEELQALGKRSHLRSVTSTAS